MTHNLSVVVLVSLVLITIPARSQQCGPPGCDPTAYQQCLAQGYGFNANNCSCIYPPSPIVIDVRGEGFHLTDIAHGVLFTFFPNAPAIRMSWTDGGFSNGFLVLDRNHNGMIDDGTELFGNLTEQPLSSDPNGFAALAVFDDRFKGGNENGRIDPGDDVYKDLRVWIDKNHSGVNEASELFSLSDLGISAVSLNYHSDRYVDVYGNRFNFRSKIFDVDYPGANTCYDIFFQTSTTE